MNSLRILLVGTVVLCAAAVTSVAAQEERAPRDPAPEVQPAPPPPPPPAPAPVVIAVSRDSSGASGSPDDGGRRRPTQDSERAVPRGSVAEPRGSGSTRPDSSASQPSRSGGSDRAVPRSGRSRGDRPAVGQAIPRSQSPFRTRPGAVFLPYTAGYYPYPYGTFGLGYFYFDPLWWGYPSYGYGPGWYGYGTGWSGSGAGYSSYGFRDVGGLRLKVKPRLAQVFVDGYYVGLVNDFDGVFQRLTIDAGPHRIEIRAEGFEPLAFEVLILEGETISYRGELRRR